MTTFVRPTKIGGNQQYVDEVASGYPELPPSELDDDLNVLYDAVNRPIPTDSVGPPQIVDRSITYNQVALKTLTNGEIADKTITNAQIANGTITAGLLDPNIVIPIGPQYITNAMLQDGCVSDSKVTSVGWSKITGAPAAFPPSGVAGGDLAGTYPNPTVRAGLIPTALPPSGAAGGDLIGTYPNPVVGPGKINRAKTDPDLWLLPIPTAAEVNKTLTVTPGPILTWVDSPPAMLTPGQVSTSFIADAPNGVTDAKISTVSWAKVTGAPTTYPPSGTAGGDLQGTYPNPTLKVGLIPASLPPSGPATGDLSGTYPAPAVGAGKITPGKLDRAYIESGAAASGDLAGTYPAPTLRPGVLPTTLPPNGPAGGDLTGTYPNPTIAASQKLWQIAGATITPVDVTKAVALAALTNPLIASSFSTKVRLAIGQTADIAQLTLNRSFEGVRDDVTKPAWYVSLRADSDLMQVGHVDAAGTGFTPLTLDANGKLALPGTIGTPGAEINYGPLTIKNRLQGHNTAPQTCWGVNRNWLNSNAQDDATKSSWGIQMRADSDQLLIQRAAPGVPGTQQQVFLIDGPTGKTSCVLADASVSKSMLAVNASVWTAGAAAVPANFNSNAAAWTIIASVAITVRAAASNVFLFGEAGLRWLGSNASTPVYMAWTRDRAVLQSWSWDMFASGSGFTGVPLPVPTGYDNGAAAGAHTYALEVYVGINNGSVQSRADNPGVISAWCMS